MLGNLAHDDHDNVAAITGAGDICVVMSAHTGDADVQIHACGALGNLAIDDNTTAIVVAGGIDVVLTTMTTYLGRMDV